MASDLRQWALCAQDVQAMPSTSIDHFKSAMDRAEATDRPIRSRTAAARTAPSARGNPARRDGRNPVSIIAMCTVAFLLATAVLSGYQRLTFRRSQSRELSSLAQLIGDVSAPSLALDDRSDAQAILAALRAERHIVSAYLFDLGDRLVAQYHRGREEPATVPRPEEDGFLLEGGHAVLVSSVLLDGDRIGTVYLQSDPEGMASGLERYGGVVAASSLLASVFLLALLLSTKLQRIIVGPILSLVTTAKGPSDARGFQAAPPAGPQEEMALLVDDLTGLFGKIEMLQQAIRYEAIHDTLTDLPNRALFLDRLEQALERSKRKSGSLVAVLLLDVDDFKVVNDSLGHASGDKLLVEIGHRLGSCMRLVDTMARFGGDEFTILLEDLNHPSEATIVTERIYKELASPFDVDGHEVFTTVSIGIAVNTRRSDRAEDLLRAASTAMNSAKVKGPGRLEIFVPSMHSDAVARLELEADLRRAIERGGLELHYQPIVSLAEEGLIGLEALIRWQHPERGLLPPAAFLPLAEQTGLIVPLGRWVLNEACRQMSAWQNRDSRGRSLKINVNLALEQLLQPDLVEQIERTLHETGLDAKWLELELTEQVIMDPQGVVIRTLSQLKDLGVGLAIDDFGTGHSSLAHLHRFPIDVLKIDRSFISRVDTGTDEHTEIVRTITALGRHLGLKVLAEGIETPEQLEKLKALDCEYGQGFLFSKPLDSDAAATWIGERLV